MVGNGRRFGSVGDGRRLSGAAGVAVRIGWRWSALSGAAGVGGRDRDGVKVSAVVGVAMVAATVGGWRCDGFGCV